MTKIESLRLTTEICYNGVIGALYDLVNAITNERDYYRDLCEKNEQDKEKSDKL